MLAINLDEDLRNADWAKKSWDLLDITSEAELKVYLERTGRTLEEFKELPVYQAAPWLGKSITKSLLNLVQGADWARERGLVPQSGNWEAPGRWVLPAEGTSSEEGQQPRLFPADEGMEEFDDESDPTGVQRLAQSARLADFSPDTGEAEALAEVIREASGTYGVLSNAGEDEAAYLKDEVVSDIALRLDHLWSGKQSEIRLIAGAAPEQDEEPEQPMKPEEPLFPAGFEKTDILQEWLESGGDLPEWEEDEDEPDEWYSSSEIYTLENYKDELETFEAYSASYENDMDDYQSEHYDWEQIQDERGKIYGRSTNYDAVNTLIATWAATSGDTHPSAIAMQMMAKKEFGLENSEDQHMKDAIAENKYNTRDDNNIKIANIVANHGDTYREFLRAQYDSTQEFFKTNDVKAVTMFRGALLGKDSVDWDDMNKSGIGITNLTHQPISSYSVTSYSAKQFSGATRENVAPTSEDEEPRKHFPSMAIIRVPVADILSTCASGYGCLNEGEVTVLGHQRAGMLIDLDILRDKLIAQILEDQPSLDQKDISGGYIKVREIRTQLASVWFSAVDDQVSALQTALEGGSDKYVAPFAPEEESKTSGVQGQLYPGGT